MSRRRLGAVCLLFSTGALTGCVRGDGAAAPEIVVRDSAGIEIVEIPGALVDALPLWRISPEPVLSIGEVDGEQPYLFTTINPHTNVAVLSDGSLAISDGLNSTAGSREIRLFDPSGRFIRAIGRAGEGPGEFTQPPNVQASAEGGIVAFEVGRSRKLSEFSLDGALRHTRPGTLVSDCPRQPCTAFGGVLSNGAVVLTYAERPEPDSSNVGRTYEDLDHIFGYSTDAGYVRVDSILGPAERVYMGALPSGTQVLVVRPLRLQTPIPEIVAGKDHAATILRDRAELRLIDASGRLVRIVRVLRPPQPFSAEERDAILAANSTTRSAGARVEGRDVVESRPSFGEVRFGENDELWIWDYRYEMEGAPPAADFITIIAADGQPVARLEVRPDPLFRDQVRAQRHETVSSRDLFRVVTADALGVNRLLGFRILK